MIDLLSTRALRVMTICLAVSLAACAANSPAGPRYRVLWTAERVTDHAPLAASSTVVALGGSARVETGEHEPTEGRPTITEFRVHLQRGRSDGVIEAISKASVRELVKTPKGKLRRQKRAIGALIPLQVGEKQLTSSASDPIAVSLQLEPVHSE